MVEMSFYSGKHPMSLKVKNAVAMQCNKKLINLEKVQHNHKDQIVSFKKM